MKNCKKIALLAIVFILSTVLNVYAASAEVTLTPSATQIKAGETVTVTLSAKCDTGIEGIDSTLEYDKTKLQLNGEAAATGFTSMSGEDLVSGEYKLSVLYTNTTAAPTEANFVTLTFEALDTVTVDETLSIKLTGIEVGDSDDEWFTVEDKEVTLTVVAEEQNPGDEEQNPGDEEQNPGDEEQNPGDEEQNPGDEEQNPGDEEQNPGDEEQNPGDEEQNPGDEEQNPGNEEQNPGNEEQKPTDKEEKDPTIADKPINNAGATNFAFIIIAGIVIVSIVLYTKCRKYKDVK